MGSVWTPILRDSVALKAARDSIDAIYADILAPADHQSISCSYYYERALLELYLWKSDYGEVYLERAIESLNQAIDVIDSISLYPHLFGGLSGIGWVIEHVRSHLLHLDDSELLTDSIDSRLIETLSNWRPDKTYDLIGGLVGIGVYFLERYPAGVSAEGLDLILSWLERNSLIDEHGISWHTHPSSLPPWQRKISPDGYFNFGVAHGLPGVIFLLDNLAQISVMTERANNLLRQSVRWFINNDVSGTQFYHFPSWRGRETTKGARLAWCYGDLGVFGVFRQVSANSASQAWRTLTSELLETCLNWPDSSIGVKDAPLCHGAFGIAHVFNRGYQALGDSRLLDKTLLWLNQGLGLREPGKGIGGFRAYQPASENDPSTWISKASFLDGSVGIALALLASCSNPEPRWDHTLLLSSSLSSKPGRSSEQEEHTFLRAPYCP